MRLVEFTQRTNDVDARSVYVNPEHVRGLHRIKDDGTGIECIQGFNTVTHVNENIHYVAAALQGKRLPKKPKRRQHPRKHK